MRLYGKKLERIYAGQDLDPILESTRKKVEFFGPTEFPVINQYTHNEVTHCLTRKDLTEACKKNKFYVRKAYLRKIIPIPESSVTKEKILEFTQRHRSRSFFVIKDNANPKKLSFSDLIAQITPYNIVDMFCGIKYPEDYPYKIEVKR